MADCVNDVASTRSAWAEVAARSAARLLNVEVICSDAAEHRRRIEMRRPDLEGQVLPEWRAVASRAFEPWVEPRLILDTAALSVAEAVERVVARSAAAPPSG